MNTFNEVNYSKMAKNTELVFVADIGGTNSNFAIVDISKDKSKLIKSFHIKSKDINNFATTVAELLNYINKNFKIKFEKACFGVAGAVSQNPELIKPTNLKFCIDMKEIIQKTNLKFVTTINDFQAVAYGLDQVAKKDLCIVYKGEKNGNHPNKGIIGAGTGLGKSILFWDKDIERYIAIPSEGGHADFPMQNEFEFKMLEYIKSTFEKTHCYVSWEDILSGAGIRRIYNFLGKVNKYKKTEISKEIIKSDFNPDLIFRNWQNDKQCKDTYELFSKFYGRCTKNFALEALAISGIYIAGGIASKNLSLFKQKNFINEFLTCGKQEKMVKKIPITVIADYNVSLFGAANYLKLL